jgi:hypothetical protein
MILYKLTNQDLTTYGGCLWGKNVTHTADGQGELCSEHWLHAYEHPLIAIFLNPIHGDFSDPILWECDGVVGTTDHGLKVGCTSLTTLRQIPLPVVTTEQCVRFAIACTVSVYQEPNFMAWVTSWISGTDRSEESVDMVTELSEVLSWSASLETVWSTMYVVHIMTSVIIPALLAAIRVWLTMYVVHIMTRARARLTVVATAAAVAANWACAVKNTNLDLIACAEWAMRENTTLPVNPR